MSDSSALKMVEAGVLLAALLVFVWWQRRDLQRAKEATALQRAAELRQQAQPVNEPVMPASVEDTQAPRQP